MMHRSMPVGVDDFKELVENYYLVDKTDFIRQIIDGHSKVTLITRPRRFGKTLTMSMLDYFFSLEKRAETEHLFDGLAIDQAGVQYMSHRGESPTVFVTLRGVKQESFADMLGDFRAIVGDLFAKHASVLPGTVLRQAEAEYFQRVVDYKADKLDLERSLLKLCEFLSRAYGKPVILLIDEYDVPIQHGWECGYYNEGIAFMKNFLGNALKGNPYLDFAVITGVLRVGKESIFSDLNNLEACSVFINIYSDVFGFTYDEVAQMAQDLGCPEQLPVIKSWYDGYHFGDSEIYNPWSVINFFRQKNTPRAYWRNTSSNSLLQEMLPEAGEKRLDELRLLLEGGTVWTQINDRVVYDDIRRDDLALYTLLLTTGYLTVKTEELDGDDIIYELRIPNREVRSAYSAEILSRIGTGVGQKDFTDMRRHLLHGEAEKFANELQIILIGIVSVYDTASKESFYHGLMLGLVATLIGQDRYTVESNRESGHGRFDIALVPRDVANPGVVMEFKVADKLEAMKTRAQEALQQIEKKKYTAGLKAAGVKDVWCYGVAFYGKDVYIARK